MLSRRRGPTLPVNVAQIDDDLRSACGFDARMCRDVRREVGTQRIDVAVAAMMVGELGEHFLEDIFLTKESRAMFCADLTTMFAASMIETSPRMDRAAAHSSTAA
jgi:hypothetical protein